MTSTASSSASAPPPMMANRRPGRTRCMIQQDLQSSCAEHPGVGGAGKRVGQIGRTGCHDHGIRRFARSNTFLDHEQFEAREAAGNSRVGANAHPGGERIVDQALGEPVRAFGVRSCRNRHRLHAIAQLPAGLRLARRARVTEAPAIAASVAAARPAGPAPTTTIDGVMCRAPRPPAMRSRQARAGCARPDPRRRASGRPARSGCR